MNKILGLSALILVSAFMEFAASAQMTEDAARSSLALFYKALNAVNAKDAPGLISQSTTPDWVTCRGNDLCNTRDEVMAGVGQRLKAIPDLKWEIKEILVSGNRVIVRGEATGTPTGELMGTPTNGKSFKLMSWMFTPWKAARLREPITSKIGRVHSGRCRRNDASYAPDKPT